MTLFVEIVYVLMSGDRQAQASDDPSQWPTIYAHLLREQAAD